MMLSTKELSQNLALLVVCFAPVKVLGFVVLLLSLTPFWNWESIFLHRFFSQS